MNNKNKTKYIVQAGIIAALYIVTTYISAALGLAYGSLQFRISEALTILPVFTPAAIPGLALGCFLSNLSSPLGAVDWIFGALATMIGALGTRSLRKFTFNEIPFLAPLAPVISNTVIIGLLLTLTTSEQSTSLLFLTFGTGIFLSEFVCCYLGIPLFVLIKKTKIYNYLFL